MKQQFRFLIAGFSLIGLLLYTATPASAQADSTTFSVTLMALNISVSPRTITLGTIASGAKVQSQGANGTPAAFSVNLGPSPVEYFVAGTNTKAVGTNNAVVWRLAASGQDQFMFEIDKQGTPTPLTGPPPEPGNPAADQFPAVGPIVSLGVQFQTQVHEWSFTAPTQSQATAAQEFNITFAAAPPGSAQQQVTQAFRIPAPTGTTTSGATTPLPGP